MNSTRLYSNQDQFIRWIPKKDVDRLYLLNAIDDRIERGRSTGVRLKGYAPALHNSSTSITASDNRANVGIGRDYADDISAGRVKQAQAKIEVWPRTGDVLAVIIRSKGRVQWPKGVKQVRDTKNDWYQAPL